MITWWMCVRARMVFVVFCVFIRWGSGTIFFLHAASIFAARGSADVWVDWLGVPQSHRAPPRTSGGGVDMSVCGCVSVSVRNVWGLWKDCVLCVFLRVSVLASCHQVLWWSMTPSTTAVSGQVWSFGHVFCSAITMVWYTRCPHLPCWFSLWVACRCASWRSPSRVQLPERVTEAARKGRQSFSTPSSWSFYLCCKSRNFSSSVSAFFFQLSMHWNTSGSWTRCLQTLEARTSRFVLLFACFLCVAAVLGRGEGAREKERGSQWPSPKGIGVPLWLARLLSGCRTKPSGPPLPGLFGSMRRACFHPYSRQGSRLNTVDFPDGQGDLPVPRCLLLRPVRWESHRFYFFLSFFPVRKFTSDFR